MSREARAKISGLCEFLVLDQPEPCPYLPGQTARLPFRLPSRLLTPNEFDDRLEEGDRRLGSLLYQPACSACRACEPIRVPVEHFRPDRSQRRAWKRGVTELVVTLGAPQVDEERIALYRHHKRGRDLGADADLDQEAYRGLFVDSCTTTFEIRFHLGDRLIGIALTDRAADALSAVYTYFTPDLPALSIGTFSILTQIDLSRSWGLHWMYLGYYIAANPHMSYKNRFRPHQRRIGDRWLPMD